MLESITGVRVIVRGCCSGKVLENIYTVESTPGACVMSAPNDSGVHKKLWVAVFKILVAEGIGWF